MNEFETRLLYPDGKTSLHYVAQAGFVLKSKKGTTVGIDLYLTDCVERFDGFKRLSPKVMSPSAKLDYVLASHWHLDHFDIDAMPLLMANGHTRLICTDDCRDHVKNLNLDKKRVTYVKAGDTVSCDDITVHAVFCDHGENTPLAVGFVFTMTFYKGGSLWPCILAHSVIDVTSVFFSGSSVVLSWIIHIIVFALSIIYCIYLAKRVETPVINRVDMQQKEVFDTQ